MTVTIVGIFSFIIYAISEAQAAAAAAFIAINNVALPKLMKFIMDKPSGGEHHHTHSTYQVYINIYTMMLGQP